MIVVIVRVTIVIVIATMMIMVCNGDDLQTTVAIQIISTVSNDTQIY